LFFPEAFVKVIRAILQSIFVLLLILSAGIAVDVQAAQNKFWPSLKNGEKFPDSPFWAGVKKKFQDEQKIKEALDLVVKHLEEPSTRGDAVDWTRSLVWKCNFQMALNQAETGLGDLKSAPWPNSTAARLVLSLYLVDSLEQYLNLYSWEIRQRERITSKDKLELKSLSYDQIVSEIRKTYRALWKERGHLGELPIDALEEFISANSYPKNLRGTLRDFLSYAIVRFNANSSHWSPQELATQDDWEVKRLLELPTGNAPDIFENNSHPLLTSLEVLGDLRAWNQSRGDSAAVLQTYIESYENIFSGLKEDAAKEELFKTFGNTLEKFSRLPWYSWGAYRWANLMKASGLPDSLIRARLMAEKAAQRFPKETGGRNCQELVNEIEAPGFGVQMRLADGAGYRSLEIRHKNLKKVFLRYYSYSMEEYLNYPNRFNFGYLQNDAEARSRLEAFLAAHKLIKEFTVNLPATPDFVEHKTYFVGEGLPTGLYFVFASAEKSFAWKSNLLYTAHFLQSDLFFAYTTSADPGQSEYRVYRGSSGAPVAGATVELWKSDYSRREPRFGLNKTVHTDSTGRFRGDIRADNYVAVIRKEAEVTRSDSVWTSSYRSGSPPAKMGMIFTDRAAYRPNQKIFWKFLIYNSGSSLADYSVAPGSEFSIDLMDMNGQKVATQTGKANEFGTASGSFEIPAGRPLGFWSLAAHAKTGNLNYGYKSVRVEEYKRPTFFVELKAPRENVRLNARAKFEGKAQYYFGAPLTDGQVKWRVTRSPRLPSWWGWWGSLCNRFYAWQDLSRSLVVASGETKIKEDGTFEVAFTPAARESAEAVENQVGFNFQIEADVTESSGETRSASFQQTMQFTDRRARFERLETEYIDPKTIDFDVVLETIAGKGVSGNGSVRLVRLQDPSEPLMPSEEKLLPDHFKKFLVGYQTPGDLLKGRESGTSWVDVAQSLALWTKKSDVKNFKVQHRDDGRITVNLPELPAGAYRLEYEGKDTRSHTITTTQDFVVLSKQASVALPLVVVGPPDSIYLGLVGEVFIY
jgi:hypothetical protein